MAAVPRVSVLLPVFNEKPQFLSEAVASVLAQSFTDFELILIDDGSNEDTRRHLRDLTNLDSRSLHTDLALPPLPRPRPLLSFLPLERNGGVAAALNRGLAEARGQFFARMDSDDLSLPDRLKRQVEYLDRHQNISVFGGAVEIFGDNVGKRIVAHPSNPAEVVVALWFNCCLVHPSVMMRRNLLPATSLLLYPLDYPAAEDYALWLRLISESQPPVLISNLSGPPILRLRKHGGNVSTVHRDKQRSSVRRALSSALLIAGSNLNEEQRLLMADRFHSIGSLANGGEIDLFVETVLVVEAFLLRRHTDAAFAKSIREEVTKRLGEVATLSLRHHSNPSESKAWRLWLNRNPSNQLAQLLALAMPSAPTPSKERPVSSDLDCSRISVVCFSKDRAFQLHEYLRTLFKYVSGATFEVSVLYKASPAFVPSYDKLKAKFPRVRWIEERDFSSQLEEIVASSADFILWGVDDVLFYDHVDISAALKEMTAREDVISASLRLAPSVNFCHPSSQSSKVPSLHAINFTRTDSRSPRWLSFSRFEGTQDWNYPFELCATIFRKSEVLAIFADIIATHGRDGLSHPNKLEVSGSRLFSRQTHPRWASRATCLCVDRLALSVVTINRVQDVCENPIYTQFELGLLDEFFWQGKEFDEGKYREAAVSYNSVHVGDVFFKEGKAPGEET